MIAEFDRRQGWGYDGIRSCAHWLNWHCGISLTAAREKIRVGALVIKAMEAAVESIKQAEPSEESDSHTLEVSNDAPAGASMTNENRQYTRRRADALMLMAEAYLKDTKVSANTDDRYQVIVHVDSEVLAQKVFEKPSGEPDCFVEKQVALPIETARRLSCSCKVVSALTKKGEPLNIGRKYGLSHGAVWHCGGSHSSKSAI